MASTCRAKLPQVQLNLQGTLVDFERHVREIHEAVLVSLVAIEHIPKDVPISEVPGVSVGVFIGPNPTTDPGALTRASTWVTGAGLRQAIDCVGMLCEDLWKYVKLVENTHGGTLRLERGVVAGLTLTNLAQACVGSTNVIDRPGTPEKLKILKDMGIHTPWENDLKTIHAVRNCITHRHGIVAEADLKDGATSLVLEYRFSKVTLVTPSGKTMPLVPDCVIEEAGSEIHVATGYQARREFERGERISISSQEFVNIMGTIHIAGRQLVSATGKLCDSIISSMASPPPLPSAPA